MILLLQQWLMEFGVRLPHAFAYTSTRMILAALTSLMFSIFCGPYFIRKLYEMKIGQTIRTEDCPLLGQLHEKKKDTPTMGGILILISLTLSLFLWMDLTSLFTWILLVSTVWLGWVGGVDDYFKLKYKDTRGLSGRKKLLFQGILGTVIALILLSPELQHGLGEFLGLQTPQIKVEGGQQIPAADFYQRIYVPFFKEPWIYAAGALVSFLLIVFVVVGASNAVNLTDGLDGLASGCLVMAAAPFALLAFVSNHSDLSSYLNIPYIEGSGEIAVYLSAFMGACIGFLWYNSHPAQVFMGDTGSLSLGGILGVSAVLLQRELLLALVGGIFVAETLSVILQVGSFKLRNKKRIFLCTPLHHHFEYKGWAETKVVIRFWIVSLLLALIGVASLKFQ